ncbi:MAG TPA: hypothetical protein VFR41_01755, partial [Acidimicrobiia bacterium]|nr:hypothetical protein [Acidimicrobiia bacterium]
MIDTAVVIGAVVVVVVDAVVLVVEVDVLDVVELVALLVEVVELLVVVDEVDVVDEVVVVLVGASTLTVVAASAALSGHTASPVMPWPRVVEKSVVSDACVAVTLTDDPSAPACTSMRTLGATKPPGGIGPGIETVTSFPLTVACDGTGIARMEPGVVTTASITAPPATSYCVA